MHRARAEFFRHVVDLDHVVAGALRLGKIEALLDDAAGRLQPLDLVQLLDAALHLRRLGRLRAKALDEAHLFLQHRLLTRVGGLALLGIDGAGALVKIVIAGVAAHLPAVDLDDLFHDAIHHVAIVAGHHHRSGIVAQELLQPQDRFQIEIVGRLIQEERIGRLQENARQRHAHLPAARQLAHVVDHLIGRQPQAGEDGVRARLQLVAAELLIARLHLAEALDHLLRRILRHLQFQPRQLFAEIGHLAGAGDGLGQDGAAAQVAGVLTKVADGQLLGPLDAAVVGALLAGDETEQRGLARAVGPHQADFLARVDLKRRVDEQNLSAVLLRDVGKRNHGRVLARERPG